ncbi:MAG: hypothetical protein GIW97_03700 [Candidatus Eremiobacteraeota bacterium]|nr:hypothetical protein [Candidatus Eremiobacteraeota bacterium]
MAVDPTGTERPNGLSTALNVIVAPREAFETLRVAPMWAWALIIALVTSLIGTYLAGPAQMHAVHAAMVAQMAADPNLDEAQRNARIAMGDKFGSFSWAFIPLIIFLVVALQSLIMLIFNAIGSGSATFKHFWATSMNIMIPGFGLYSLVVGILALVRGVNAYNSTSDIYLSVPSLAWIAPHAGVKTVAFLYYFNPFFLWAAVLIAMAMQIVARVPKVQAYLTAATIFFGGAIIQLVTAR